MSYIAIIDIGINNVRSILGAVKYLGFKVIISNKENIIMNSSGLIIPGVGSFPAGMKKLKTKGLDKVIKKYHKMQKPILAICLGFQMLFTSSEEFKNTKGLNILTGKIKSLKKLKTNNTVPNLGWKKLEYKKKKSNYLFKGLKNKPSVYFIHSYYAEVKDKELVTSTINFGKKKVTSSIQHKNIFGVQFHPEKSSKDGINIVKNFLDRIEK
jgi:glutamine amidotransferase